MDPLGPADSPYSTAEVNVHGEEKEPLGCLRLLYTLLYSIKANFSETFLTTTMLLKHDSNWLPKHSTSCLNTTMMHFHTKMCACACVSNNDV
jgi:hypothetical protein